MWDEQVSSGRGGVGQLPSAEWSLGSEGSLSDKAFCCGEVCADTLESFKLLLFFVRLSHVPSGGCSSESARQLGTECA